MCFSIYVFICLIISANLSSSFQISKPHGLQRFNKRQLTFSCRKSLLELKDNSGGAFTIDTSSWLKKLRHRVSPVATKAARIIGPMVLQFILISVLTQVPVFAKSAESEQLKAFFDKRNSGKSSLLQKLFLGANAKGSFKSWKAGDTRSEISMLINGVTMTIILFFVGCFAYALQKKEEFDQLRAMKREVIREKEYRENMAFESVEEILQKLEDPKIKSSVKASLKRQLQELDPDEKIRNFIEGKADRPDLSDRLSGSALKRQSGKGNNKKIEKSKKSDTTKNISSSNDDDLNDDSIYEDNTAEEEPVEEEEPEEVTPVYVEILQDLNKSLKTVLPKDKRLKLMKYLQNRLKSLPNDSKRDAVATKLKKRMGDDEYWIEYVDNI